MAAGISGVDILWDIVWGRERLLKQRMQFASRLLRSMCIGNQRDWHRELFIGLLVSVLHLAANLRG